MPSFSKKKQKTAKNTAPQPAEPSKSDISGLSAEALETAASPEPTKEPDKNPEAAPKPGAAEKPKTKSIAEKFAGMDKSRLMGAAATVVCVGCLGVFVLYQIFSGIQTNPRQQNPDPTQDPDQNTPGVTIPGQATKDGVELEIQSGQNDIDTTVTGIDPFNRGQWDDYKLETEDGDQAAENRGAEVESGARYWVRARDGSNMYKIIIPTGYIAADLGDCVTVGTGNYETTGSEPVTFFWRKGADIKLLLDHGYRDLAGNSTGYAQYDVRALGYYLFRDESGDDWPVVTAVMTREEINPDIDAYQEYWIIIGKPANDNRYLVGTIPAESFADLATQLYPNISAFAKALFPASSVPDFPDYWQIPSEKYPGQTETPNATSETDLIQTETPDTISVAGPVQPSNQLENMDQSIGNTPASDTQNQQ